MDSWGVVYFLACWSEPQQELRLVYSTQKFWRSTYPSERTNTFEQNVWFLVSHGSAYKKACNTGGIEQLRGYNEWFLGVSIYICYSPYIWLNGGG